MAVKCLRSQKIIMTEKIARRLGILLSVVLFVAGIVLFAPSARAANVEVVMGADSKLQFEPAEVTIAPGDTITFSMGQVGPHNVIFDAKQIPGQDKKLAKKLSAAQLVYDAGDTVEIAFPSDIKPGVYPYFCQPHRGAGMYGKVIVQ